VPQIVTCRPSIGPLCLLLALSACASRTQREERACEKPIERPTTLLPVTSAWAARYRTTSPGRVEGQIVLQDTTHPPSSVQVAIYAPPARRVVVSSATGEFVFDSVPPGRHRVSMRYIGYRPWEDSLTVSADSGVRLVVVLLRDFTQLCPVYGVEQGFPIGRASQPTDLALPN
jgi:hypothetical protein